MTNIFKAIIELFDLEMTTPQPYGTFHICCAVIAFCICFLLCRRFKAPDEKTLRKILLIYSLVCITFEVYKQISFTFDVTDGAIVGNYQWYAFPFQFCSVPMYVALLGALIPGKKFLNACIAFLSTFGLIAGTLTMVMPDTIFIETIGINIQTMVHHGGQVVIGLFLLIRAKACKTLGSTLGGVCVFLGAVATALVLNVTVIKFVGNETFNMFFISPYFTSTLPVYSAIQPAVPYPVFLILYIFPFITAALLMHVAIYILPRLISRKSKTTR